MKIGIVTSFASKNPAGLERFFIDLIKSIDVALEADECVVYCSSGSDLDEVFAQHGVKNIRVVKVGGGVLWKHIGLFFVEKSDVYIFNGPLTSLFFRPRQYLVLVYDFAYKHIPANSLKKKCKTAILDFFSWIAFRRAQKIITISEATKSELMQLFGVSAQRINVIHCGFTRICDLQEKSVANIPKKYFFFVGTFKERKNVLNIVKSFALFSKKDPYGYALVLAGKSSKSSEYMRSILRVIKKENIEDRVIFIGHISDNELVFLYKNATALVFPSLLEGFGLPVLEAMSCGVPVITSTVSSLPEVAGDAALLVDPYSIEEIAESMRVIIENESLRNELIKKGYEQIKNFSWEKAANEMTSIIRSI